MILKPYDQDDGRISELRRLLSECSDRQTRQDIEREMNKVRAGENGEREAAKLIRRVYGADERVGVFHNLNIPENNDTGSRIEIDCLIVDGQMRRAWVLEIKNWSGTVGMAEDESWWQKNRSGETSVVGSPVTQARAGREAVAHWLKQNDFPIREVIAVVAFAPTVDLDHTNIDERHGVMKIDLLDVWRKIEDGDYSLWTFISRIREDRRQKIARKELEQLRDKLLHDHRDQKMFYRSKFGISPPEHTYDATPPVIAINDRIRLDYDPAGSRYRVSLKDDMDRTLLKSVWSVIKSHDSEAKWDGGHDCVVLPVSSAPSTAALLRKAFP